MLYIFMVATSMQSMDECGDRRIVYLTHCYQLTPPRGPMFLLGQCNGQTVKLTLKIVKSHYVSHYVKPPKSRCTFLYSSSSQSGQQRPFKSGKRHRQRNCKAIADIIIVKY